MSIENNPYERLTAQVEFPEAWIPEPGDTLVGEVVRWETGTTKEDRTQEILVVRDKDGIEHSVWTWAAKLRYDLIAPKTTLDELERAGGPLPDERQAMPGDFVAIHYRGKSPMPGGGLEAHSYRTAIEKKVENEAGDEREVFDDDIPF